jgi:hypothetical protein
VVFPALQVAVEQQPPGGVEDRVGAGSLRQRPPPALAEVGIGLPVGAEVDKDSPGDEVDAVFGVGDRCLCTFVSGKPQNSVARE